MKRNAAAFVGFLLIPAAGLWFTCASPDLDERFSARPGGELYVDLTLGKGISFDRGSLVVTSHAANEVRVVAETTGWGEYAVDLEAREVDGGVKVVGKVEGWLHWLFGGPTVDVVVAVPRDYRVDARIDGGPLLLEDLVGPIVARVDGSDETKLTRAEGDIQVVLQEGDFHAEDVTGRLEIETDQGDIHVSGVEGRLEARARSGSIWVESVDGGVELETASGRIDVEGLRGRLRATSEGGRVELEDVEGEVEVSTRRGRIEVEELDGPILARSGRGRVEVEFVGDPVGNIETQRGQIEIEVPYSAGFELDALTRRGGVKLDHQFAIAERATPRDPADEASAGDLARLGQEVAVQMTHHVRHTVSDYLDQGFETGNWEWRPEVRGAWRWQERSDRWEWDPSSDAADQQADAEAGGRPPPPAEAPAWPLDGVAGRDLDDLEDTAEQFEDERWGDDRPDDDAYDRRRLVGPVNGGGGLLRLRSGRGDIHVREN